MNRPDGVTMIAIWCFFLAGGAVLGLGGLSLGLLGVWTSADAEGIIFGTFGLLIGVLAVTGFGVACAVTGFGLWRQRSWARGAARVLAIIQLLGIPIGTAVGIAVLVYFARNENARRAFDAPEGRAA